MLTRILNKVEGSKQSVEGVKNDISTLLQTIGSYLVNIEQLETQFYQISTHVNLW